MREEGKEMDSAQMYEKELMHVLMDGV